MGKPDGQVNDIPVDVKTVGWDADYAELEWRVWKSYFLPEKPKNGKFFFMGTPIGPTSFYDLYKAGADDQKSGVLLHEPFSWRHQEQDDADCKLQPPRCGPVRSEKCARPAPHG
jgi:hypothetical protein